MRHLGRWLTALVDDELDDVERDRLLNHLAGCGSCRREANELRALKRRMTALGDTGSESTAAGRLVELPGPDAIALARPDGRDAGWRPPRPGTLSRRARQVRDNWKTVSGIAGAAVVAVAAGAFLLGGGQAQPAAPRIIPAVDAYWREHSYDTGQAPATRSGLAAPGASIAPGTLVPRLRQSRPSVRRSVPLSSP
ncbi:MAG TPA: zf-HC2 domain-containing protein [Streptosporangiaceae bacterium]|nr:zf-HC2 domain-containing protein [Streptosporangiaceae bacterium]